MNHLNTNKQFMLGNGLLAFAVIFVVVLFLYMSFRLQRKEASEVRYAEIYQIELAGGFVGDSLSVYVNDSLLYDAVVRTDTLRFSAPRTADDNVLVVESHRTHHTDYFNLKPEGGLVRLVRKDQRVLLR